MASPARCAFKLSQGKRLNHLMGTGPYEVCVTPTQAARLFGREKPRKIGCGAFACAYTAPEPDKVVKVTRDRSDVEALIRGQAVPFVPRVYQAFKLDSQHRWRGPLSGGRGIFSLNPPIYPKAPPEVYAVEVERVRPLARAEKAKWQRRMACVRSIFVHRDPYSETAPKRQPSAPRALSWMPERYYPMMEIGCCPRKAGPAKRDCQQGVRQIGHAVRLLREVGIDPHDLHAGNIGVGQDGKWKLIDLGMSSIGGGLKHHPWALKGAAARRRR